MRGRKKFGRVGRVLVAGVVILACGPVIGQVGTPSRVFPVPGDGQPPAAEAARTKGWLNYASETTIGEDPHGDVLSPDFGGFIFRPGEKPAFPLNIGLLESPLPGDFLPVGGTMASDSMMLVPAGKGGRTTSWNGLSRATLHSAVDLVTGVPLAQFTDLSLPFGGAEFRLNRTRSAVRDVTGRSTGSGVQRSAVENRFWDWVGSGWMMSENPILIIDSRGPDQVGARQPRCWLWLDAFHSIPFDWVEDSTTTEGTGENARDVVYGHYDCAPRFRAKLRVSRSDEQTPRRIGQNAAKTEARAGDWLEGKYPDKFTVTMFEGDVVYEFTPVWQDVPHWEYKWESPVANPRVVEEWSSLHGRPRLPIGPSESVVDPAVSTALADPSRAPWMCSPINSGMDASGLNGRGLGMSYYGLLDSVRDKQGNKAEFKYATVCEFATNLGATQWTTQKGALSEVKLYAAGDAAPTWTLVYGYRLVPRVGDHGVEISDLNDSLEGTTLRTHWNTLSQMDRIAWSDPALESVYVFTGNVETRGITLFRPPEESLWADGESAPHRWPTDSDDLLARFQANGIRAWYATSATPSGSNDISNRTDWMFRCRYSYASTDQPNGRYPNAPGIETGSAPVGYLEGVRYSPRLVRSELQQRDALSSNVRTLRNYVFQYDNATGSDVANFGRLRWLNSIFDDAGIARIHAEVRGAGAASFSQTLEELVSGYVFDNGPAENSLSLASGKSEQDFRDAAEIWFGTGDDGFHIQLSGLEWDASRNAMLPGKTSEYCTDSGETTSGLAKALSVTDPETGRRRHYRITRLIHGPGDFSTSGIGAIIPTPEFPMRCLFTSPYLWQAYPHGNRYRWPTFAGSFNWITTTGNGTAASTEVAYDKHRWVAIVDEFGSWNDARESNSHAIPWAGMEWRSFPQRAISRRIIAMNPQGNVLWEKTYTMQHGAFAEGGDTGLNETYIYRSGKELLLAKGVNEADISSNVATEQFLVQRRTVGYAAAPIAVPIPQDGSHPAWKSQGLIYTYDYADVAPEATGFTLGERFKPVSEGIQRGDSYSGAPSGTGIEKILRRTYYDDADPTIVLGTAQFTSPPGATEYKTLNEAITDASKIAILSRIETRREPNNSTGPYTREEQRTISPARVIRPGGPAYYDVSISISNERGEGVWSINAFVQDPSSLATSGDAFARVLLNYNKYGAYGRLEKSWVDVEKSDSFVDSADRALLPAGLDRHSPGSAAVRSLTEHVYDWDGLSDIVYPNGKRWARRIVRQVPGTAEPQVNNKKDFDRVYTFNELVASGIGYKTQAVGSITEYKRYAGPDNVFLRRADKEGSLNEVIENRQVTFSGVIAIDNLTPSSSLTFKALAKTEFGFDSAGRIHEVKLLEHTAIGSVAAVADVSDNADRVTTTDLDGTVTRILRNGRGQVTRTYVGTNATDLANAWDDNGWPESPDPDPLATTNRFDMLLKSRVELGATANNALLPARQWTYLKQPAWTPAQLAPFGAPHLVGCERGLRAAASGGCADGDAVEGAVAERVDDEPACQCGAGGPGDGPVSAGAVDAAAGPGRAHVHGAPCGPQWEHGVRR